MGVCARCVWTLIVLAVIVVGFFIYFFYPPFCISGPECNDDTPAPAPTRAAWETDYHLPSFIRPSFYSVLVVPDLTTGTFSGAVTITLDVTATADHILVNIDGPRVSTTVLTRGSRGGSTVQLREAFEYSPNHFWVVVPRSPLQPGRYSLYLEYSGSMTREIVGLYMGNYTAPNGESR